MATFVLNDETKVNSYGFRIPNKGIDLSRFKANPVMLNQHQNSTSGVLGKWKNIRVEGSLLLADDDFDTEDPEAMKIKGKVDRGFIKGASMGLTFERDRMKQAPDGVWELTKCQKLESSIVAVPSNAGSIVRLYVSDTGELMEDNAVKLCLSAITKTENFNTNKMEKLVLSAAVLVALGLQNADDVAAVQNAVTKLSADYIEEKTKRLALEKKVKDMAELQAKTLVTTAKAEGRAISAELEADIIALASISYESAAKIVGAIPTKQSLSATIIGGGGAAATEVKTVEDFSKLSLEKQLAFKNDNPDAYKALFA